MENDEKEAEAITMPNKRQVVLREGKANRDLQDSVLIEGQGFDLQNPSQQVNEASLSKHEESQDFVISDRRKDYLYRQ